MRRKSVQKTQVTYWRKAEVIIFLLGGSTMPKETEPTNNQMAALSEPQVHHNFHAVAVPCIGRLPERWLLPFMLVPFSPGMICKVEDRMRCHLTLRKGEMQPSKLLPEVRLEFPFNL